MRIGNLSDATLEDVVECLLAAFKGYFVEFPKELDFWEKRFHNAGVDWKLSSGVYDDGKLVAFMIQAVRDCDGLRTAYNTGTGVLPAYRGQQLVDKMYTDAYPRMKEDGIECCTLEVIDKNEKAIRVYRRCGFEILHKMKCYSGDMKSTSRVRTEEIKLATYPWSKASPYSWDNSEASITRSKGTFKAYRILYDDGTEQGRCILNPSNGYVAQLETTDGNWKAVIEGIASFSSKIRINNVHESRKNLIDFLDKHGFNNTIDQYYMKKVF